MFRELGELHAQSNEGKNLNNKEKVTGYGSQLHLNAIGFKAKSEYKMVRHNSKRRQIIIKPSEHKEDLPKLDINFVFSFNEY